MNHELLIKNLRHPQANVRLGVARVIGMVEETRALDALREVFNSEQDLDARNAMLNAGRRVKVAAERGFNTIDALCQHFGIFRELREVGDPDEAAKLKTIMNQMENDLLRDQMRAQEEALRRQNSQSAGLMMGMLLTGNPNGYLNMVAGGMTTPTADVLSSNLGSKRMELAAKRDPARKPTQEDIKRQVQRLREDPDAEDRRKAVIQLGDLNNVAALPFLAEAFARDSADSVRQTAERIGKVLYWNAIYWQLEESGEIETLMREKAQELKEKGGTSDDQALQIPQVPREQPDINDILRQAEQARKRKGRGR